MNHDYAHFSPDCSMRGLDFYLNRYLWLYRTSNSLSNRLSDDNAHLWTISPIFSNNFSTVFYKHGSDLILILLY